MGALTDPRMLVLICLWRSAGLHWWHRLPLSTRRPILQPFCFCLGLRWHNFFPGFHTRAAASQDGQSMHVSQGLDEACRWKVTLQKFLGLGSMIHLGSAPFRATVLDGRPARFAPHPVHQLRCNPSVSDGITSDTSLSWSQSYGFTADAIVFPGSGLFHRKLGSWVSHTCQTCQ